MTTDALRRLRALRPTRTGSIPAVLAAVQGDLQTVIEAVLELAGRDENTPPVSLAGPQDAASAPEAPGQPGRGEEGSGGHVEALARVLRSVGVEIGYAGADTYRTVVAERILADRAD